MRELVAMLNKTLGILVLVSLFSLGCLSSSNIAPQPTIVPFSENVGHIYCPDANGDLGGYDITPLIIDGQEQGYKFNSYTGPCEFSLSYHGAPRPARLCGVVYMTGIYRKDSGGNRVGALDVFDTLAPTRVCTILEPGQKRTEIIKLIGGNSPYYYGGLGVQVDYDQIDIEEVS